MLKKQFKNKKGWAIGPLVTAYSILVLVLVFIIFGMLFRLGDKDRIAEIKSATSGTEANKILLNHLRDNADGKENIASDIRSAMIKETDKEKNSKKLQLYELPASYSLSLDLFHKNLVRFYRPDCVFLELKHIEPPNKKPLRTRNLGYCNRPEYSTSTLIPLSIPNDLINITMATSEADESPSTLKWCLELNLLTNKWACPAYYPSAGGPCKGGAIFSELSSCQIMAAEYNEREDPGAVNPTEIIDDIIEQAGEEGLLGKWVLCEYVLGRPFECTCAEYHPLGSCPYQYNQIGEGSYDSKEECKEQAERLQSQNTGKCEIIRR